MLLFISGDFTKEQEASDSAGGDVKREKKEWKQSYIRRYVASAANVGHLSLIGGGIRRNIETNWHEGRYKVTTFPGHTSTRVRCLQFDDDKMVRTLYAQSMEERNLIHSSSIFFQAMGSFDQRRVHVLDFQTRRSLQELIGHTGAVMSLRFDRNILLSASRDRTVKST